PLDLFERVVSINLVGTFNVTRLAAAAMATHPVRNGDRGVIVMTASVAGYEGQKGQAAYAASKAGVIGLVLPMARDLATRGVRVVGIAPGTFSTPMLHGLTLEQVERLAAGVPHPQRLGEPDEFAAFVETVVDTSYLNGEVVRLDGALRLG
ncbi:MAG: SDR family NAD(P)-dependent oxidoreductase, partial [Planctomycetota bacterium]